MKRELGRSGIEVSAMGLGGWAMGGPFRRTDGTIRQSMGWGQVDNNESIRAIHRAINLGITLFDTANNYGAGHSECVLGQALTGWHDQVVIATKFASVPIPGFKTVQQVEDNAGAMRFGPLRQEQMRQIDNILGHESVLIV